MWIQGNENKKRKTANRLICRLPSSTSNTSKEQETVAETIENNVGKEIVEKTQTNPKYYEKMSALLRELVEKRKKDVINYEEYLHQIVELAKKVHKPESGMEYPAGIRESAAKRAFYDYFDGDANIVNQLHEAVMFNKQDNFRGNKIKERKIWRAIRMFAVSKISWIKKQKKNFENQAR